MSGYEAAAHLFYRCQFHFVRSFKHRYRILYGNVGKELYRAVDIFCNMKKCHVAELRVHADRVHLVARPQLECF